MKNREFEIRTSFVNANGEEKHDCFSYAANQYPLIETTEKMLEAYYASNKCSDVMFDTVVKCERCKEWMRHGLMNIEKDVAHCEECEHFLNDRHETEINTEKINIAEKILLAIGKVKIHRMSSIWVDTYHNCREQGFCIVGVGADSERVEISFSEYRNSDNIVVYVNKDKDDRFSDGGVPSDYAYETKTFFGFGEFQKAADFIKSKLEERL